MSGRTHDADWGLTEKEKQTLRLIVRGHDAKSIARSLDLSIHTVNERLRASRRKMAVSSSREAARLLLEREGDAAPKGLGDDGIGADAGRGGTDAGTAPIGGAVRAMRPRWIVPGVLVMTLLLGLVALTGLPHLPAAPPQPPVATPVASDPQVVETARAWLALLDDGRWEESYRGTADSFRKMNTLEVWTSVSKKVRAPFGAAVERTFVSQENLPAPPAGYEVVKFRTRFANGAERVETVSLDREGGVWRIVGVMIG